MGRLLAWFLNLFAEDATPEQDACESCGLMALHCTDEQAATCKIRLDAVESAKGGGK